MSDFCFPRVGLIGSLVYWTKIPSFRQDLSHAQEKRYCLFLDPDGGQWIKCEYHCLKHCGEAYK